MAALAYVLLPLSGALAFFKGRRARTRFHGLQALLLGVLWPLALFLASAVSAGATLVTFVAFGLVWMLLILGTALGRDPQLPMLAPLLRRAAGTRPGDLGPTPLESG